MAVCVLPIPNALAPTPMLKNSLLYLGAEVWANPEVYSKKNPKKKMKKF
jgi:hypothetical protein